MQCRFREGPLDVRGVNLPKPHMTNVAGTAKAGIVHRRLTSGHHLELQQWLTTPNGVQLGCRCTIGGVTVDRGSDVRRIGQLGDG